MQREKFIDIAKGIGIILVVFGHVINRGELQSLEGACDIIYSFHMPLFFFISGYCLGSKTYPEGGFKLLPELKKILIRLIIPYFVWSGIYMFIAGQLASGERLKAVFTTRGIAPLWFLATLAVCEIGYFFLYAITQKLTQKTKTAVFSATAVIVLAFAYLFILLRDRFNLSTESPGVATYYAFVALGRFFMCFPLLIFGHLSAKAGIIKRMGKVAGGILGFTVLTVVGALVNLVGLETNCHLFETNNYLIFICTAILGSLGVMCISYSLESILGALCPVGMNSFGIMLLHYLPFKTLEYSISFTQLLTTGEIAVGIIATALTLAISLLGIRLVKKRFFLYSNS